MVHKVTVGVLGASGYAGRELCGLVAGHPSMELVFASANEQRGKKATFGSSEITFTATEDSPLGSVDVVFASLPHGASAMWVERARGEGARVVDLSSDLRPGNGGAEAPYGLTELNRAEIRGADVVANPGCYPTSILIALAPLFANNLTMAGGTIVANSASGVTGAGSTPKPELLFSEISENFRAYGIGNQHRHLPEMREFAATMGSDCDIMFTPHLLPVARGILSTITVPLKQEIPDPLALFRDFYGAEPFVEISDSTPSLREVLHRNVVRMHVASVASVRTPTLQITSAIDNLVKGAAGQAVQNANLMVGFEETAGLPR